MLITKAQIVAWIETYAESIHEHVGQLNKMDAAIGDGDFGASIQRGVDTATALLPTLNEADIGTTLSKMGMKMMSKMGGTSGPLTGTFYINMGRVAKGKMSLTVEEFAAAFKAGVEGVMQLGKAEVGDKTMIDAYYPAAEAFTLSASKNESFIQAVDLATEAAKVGYEKTADLISRKGRSSYVGERAVGAIDPGAYAVYLLLKALQHVVQAPQKTS